MKKKIRCLTGLRAVMMFYIMLHHMEFLNKYSYGPIYQQYINGRIGVDYFFLMSGFGMMLNKRDYKVSIRESINYAITKIKKIYPLYLFSLIFVLPCLIIYEKERHLSTVRIVKILGAKLLLCLTLLQSMFGKATLANSINGVAWFLSTLFLIYFSAPYLIKWMKKIDNLCKGIICLLITYVTIFGLANLVKTIDVHLGTSFLYYSPYFRVFYVIVGMEIAQIYRTIEKLKYPNFFECGSFVLALMWVILRNTITKNGTINPGILVISEITIAAILLFSFSFEEGKVSDFLKKGFLYEVGALSMYLFLLHYPIRMYVDLLFVKMNIFQNGYGGIVEVIVIFGISWLFANWISKLGKQQIITRKNK